MGPWLETLTSRGTPSVPDCQHHSLWYAANIQPNFYPGVLTIGCQGSGVRAAGRASSSPVGSNARTCVKPQGVGFRRLGFACFSILEYWKMGARHFYTSRSKDGRKSIDFSVERWANCASQANARAASLRKEDTHSNFPIHWGPQMEIMLNRFEVVVSINKTNIDPTNYNPDYRDPQIKLPLIWETLTQFRFRFECSFHLILHHWGTIPKPPLSR